MGGTDVTCGISHLPIQPGDPMRFIFLRHPIYQDSLHDHPWAKWLPISLALKGKYNFYGTLEDVEQTPVVKFMAETIGRYALPLPDPENARGRPHLDKYPHTIESLMKACERGFLSLEFPPDKDDDDDDKDSLALRTRISPFYVSEEMFQACIHNIEDEGKGVSTFRERLAAGNEKRTSGDALRRAYEWPAERARLKELEEKTGLDSSLLEGLDAIGTFTLRDLTSHFESTPDILVCGTSWKPDVTGLTSLAEFGEDDWKQVDEEALALRVFDFTLKHNLRREWYPTLAQSQYHFPDDELMSHRMLTRKIEERCIEIGEKYEEEYGEDDA